MKNDPVGKQEIDYPAALDLNNSIKKLEAISARSYRLLESLDTLNKIDLIANNKPIGWVIATSGTKSNAAGRGMGRALMEVEGDKMGSYPPSPAKLHFAAFPVGGAGYYNVNQDSLIRQLSTMKKNSWIIKNARTTEVTTGIVNDMVGIMFV